MSSDPKSSTSEPLVTQMRAPHQLSSRKTPGPSAGSPNNNAQGSKPALPPPKTSLPDYATPSASVSAFCRAVLQKLIPPQFYGVGQDGVRNRKIILKHVDRFIRMRRFESLSLHEVCKGLKVGARLSTSETERRTENIANIRCQKGNMYTMAGVSEDPRTYLVITLRTL